MCIITGYGLVVVITEVTLVLGMQQKMCIVVRTVGTPAPRSEEQGVDWWVLALANEGGLGVVGPGCSTGGLWLPGVGVGEASLEPLVIHRHGELSSSLLNGPRTGLGVAMNGGVEGVLEDTDVVLKEDHIHVEDSVRA